MPAAIERLPEEVRRRIRIDQQCRPEDIEAVRARYAGHDIPAELGTYFENMAERLADAHLFIGRAGASTIAELTAVGRARPYLNLGSERMERSRFAQAERDFSTAETLNDLNGNARFSMGVAQLGQKKIPEAIRSFTAAERQGYTGQTLMYQRGEAYLALGHAKEAFVAYTQALALGASDASDHQGAKDMTEQIHMRRAETGLSTQQYDAAAKDYEVALKSSPQSSRLGVGLAMALVGKGEAQKAREQMDQLIARAPSGPAYYARAMAEMGLNNKAAALKDLEEANRIDPGNAQQYAMAKAQISGVAAAKKP